MNQDAMVNAGDIARLVDVGRAAVSNWRRRHDDFPQPVGGTASSPLFSLREVEEWLRRNGKRVEVTLADRTWQRLRAAGDDLHLADRVAAAGALLLAIRDETEPTRQRPGKGEPEPPRRQPGADEPEPTRQQPGKDEEQPTRQRPKTGATAPLADPELVGLVRELSGELGPREAFEFLFGRYLEAHSRRVSTTAPDVAALMTTLTTPPGGTVLDPSCGFGTLLLAAPADATVIGQDLDPTTAAIAATRLALAGKRIDTIATGDSLRADALPAVADAVVCDPPFNERAWGHQDLTSDPRWEYGLPPRGESELAWLQHCLAHVRPGGQVAILLPAAVAGRRPGKRIRGNLLRAGALQAVISLGPAGPDLWLLRRPEPGDRPGERLLLLAAHDTLRGVETAWRRHRADPGGATRIIDLLDDDVDLSPLGHQKQDDDAEKLVRELRAATDRLNRAGIATPELADDRRQLGFTTVGELVKAGVLTVRQGPARMALGEGYVAVLTADDLAEHRAPSGWTTRDPGLVDLRAGDVVASVLGGATRVMADTGAVLGPYLTRYRADPDLLDPDFLAGVIRAAEPVAHGGSSRTDVRRVRVPRLPLPQQREYAAVFRRLADLEDTLRTAASAGETLVRLGFACLAAGHVVPPDREG
jgi:N-6 DNA methylase